MLGLAGCTQEAAPSGTTAAPEATTAEASATPTPAAGSGTDVHLLAGPSSTSIDWENCGGRFECATVLLPLDYADPEGSQVEIALKRLPASGDALGSLLVNPGGPGESGVEFVEPAENVMDPDVRERYDIVGFDPRGVGASTSVVCLREGQVDPTAVDVDLTTELGVQTLRSAYQQLAALCQERSGALLDFVGSDEVVQDMEALRGLLGEDTLNYLGYSYGTLLGALYADRYPERVGRMVLDSAVDPALDYETLQREQVEAFDAAFARYLAECHEQEGCPLDADPAAATAEIEEIAAELDEWAVDKDDLTGADLIAELSDSLYSPELWPVVTEDLTALLGDPEGLEDLEVGDLDWDESELDEESGDDGDAASPGDLASDDPNWDLWFTAVDCSDYPVTSTFAVAVQHSLELAEASPVFGAGSLAEASCVAWPPNPTAERGPVSGEGAAPILIIGSIGDPATPYAWSVSLADQLTSARLLTYDGDGHAIYGGRSACVDAAVDEYLVTGELPTEGAVCA